MGKQSPIKQIICSDRLRVLQNVTYPFHGCVEAAMDVTNPASIIQTGFLKKYWKTSAGDWQRFGPGFYFGQQVRSQAICLLLALSRYSLTDCL